MSDTLDLITIGRSSVDLYGAQIGGRLEDMGSFDKYIGGSPTNIACGTARLGLKSAVITGVGDEHMGRFIREQLQREGVNTDGVKTDPERLTALVLLGIRDSEQFPLIFYRENCADMGLTVDDIAPDFIRRARAVVATGTHLSNSQVEAATLKALNIARDAGIQTALDIDYLCDNRIGRSALHRASGTGLWVGRPTELPGSRPIAFEPELGEDLGGLREWARENVVKLLVFCHPDDDDKTAKMQIARVKRMFTAARRNNLEFLLEIIPSKVGPVDDDTSATLIQTFYDAGVHPDWWKLEPFKTEAAWANAADAITRNDPRTRGIVVLGLDAPQKALAASFALAERQPLVKGFAVGRTIFGDAARAWMKGEMTDTEAVAQMTERYWELCKLWDNARSIAQEEAT